MTMRVLLPMTMVVIVLGAAAARADDALPEADRKIIEAVIDGVGKSDLKFVRKDQVFDAKAAAWYLRFRWNNNRDKVRSVQDFIDLVSVGGEHGEITYYVQFPDGTRKPAREVLEAKVRELRAGK